MPDKDSVCVTDEVAGMGMPCRRAHPDGRPAQDGRHRAGLIRRTLRSIRLC